MNDNDGSGKKLSILAEQFSDVTDIFSQMINICSEGMTLLSSEGKIIECNEKAATIFGFNKQAVIGRHITEVMQPDMAKEFMNEFHRLAETGIMEYEVCLNNPDRTVSRLWRKVAPLLSRDHRFEGAFIYDREVQEPKASSPVNNDFLAVMSHEIRTPMNAVVGMTSLLLEGFLTEEQREYAETVQSCAATVLRKVDDFLDISRMDAGQLVFEIVDFDLIFCLEELQDRLFQRTGKKGLHLSFIVESDVPLKLRGDTSRIQQVLLCLVDNAVEFSEQGELVMHVILERKTKMDALIRFSLSDVSAQEPKGLRRFMFNPFRRVESAKTRPLMGTGLGLLISGRIAEMLGGRIDVEVVKDGVSAFRFFALFERQLDAEDVPEMSIEQIKYKKILVADDNITSREVLSSYLKSWGCTYESVSGAQDALTVLRKAVRHGVPFDMVIVNFSQKNGGSEAFGRHVKADAMIQNTTLVMLGDWEHDGDWLRVSDVGFSAHLTRPIKPTQLFDCLSGALAQEAIRTAGAAEARAVAVPSYSSNRQQRQILLVEDDLVNQKVLLRFLEKAGYTADVASNGKEAIKALSAKEYELVIMDMQMPVMDGFEATKIIRDPRSKVLNHKIPVIAVTAMAMKGDEERCLAAGMNEYITKPVPRETLYSVLAKYLADDRVKS